MTAKNYCQIYADLTGPIRWNYAIHRVTQTGVFILWQRWGFRHKHEAVANAKQQLADMEIEAEITDQWMG